MKNYKEKILNYINVVKSDARHLICIVFTIVLALFPFLVFVNAFPRLGESVNDLWTSLVFYVNELFDLGISGSLPVTEFSKLPFELPFNLPNTWDEFTVWWSDYWNVVFSSENFVLYLTSIGDSLYYVSKFLIFVLPLFLLIYVLMQRGASKTNNDYNKDSKALKRFKRFENKVYLPCKYYVIDFIKFVKENGLYWKLWLFTLALTFNFITIVIEFLAFYLYFVSSFDFKNIYVQVLKLLMDLSVVIDFIPGIGWVAIGLAVLHVLRKRIGYSRLEHMERKNRGFINERPIVLMLCGSMGKKKTTIVTDIALSQEIMFRDKAFERILEADLKFPCFPWINLELALKKAIANHNVYNLATCKRFARSKMQKFVKRPCRQNIFMYDYEKYGMTYDNKLYVADIWQVIEDYCQLYFIYVVQSSLLISNYSIRSDNVLEDLGNFPLWDMELFKRDSKYIDAYSRHAKILDFDTLRLGKKVLEDNEKADMFEFGVIDITEIGKERGNNLELQHIKKTDYKANQKNDLFNAWLKMVRHSATVDNFPFVRVITDDQRPSSWGADARELCEIVHIKNCDDTKLAMPLFFIEDFVISKILSGFSSRYYKRRFERGDNTLGMYLYKSFASKLKKYHSGTYNTFGYMKVKVGVEDGTQDGLLTEQKYYLMPKKIYSKRFSTDCYSEFFKEKALRSKIGLADLPEFATEKASFEEMLSQNAYFFTDLCEMLLKEKDG